MAGLEDCPAQNPLPPRERVAGGSRPLAQTKFALTASGGSKIRREPGEGASKDPRAPLTRRFAPPSPGTGEGKRSRLELRLFILQRLSALVLAPLVLLHLGVILYAVRGGLTAAEILGRTKGSALWAAIYGLFVLAAAVHGAIGLRAILREWLSHPRLADTTAALFAASALILGIRAVMVLT